MKQVPVGVYGVGKSFGDIDVFKQRKYMYTLRTRTRNVRYWELDALKFELHVKSHGRESAFKIWQKRQDLEMINAVARNLFNSVRGLNYDGVHDYLHKPKRNVVMSKRGVKQTSMSVCPKLQLNEPKSSSIDAYRDSP